MLNDRDENIYRSVVHPVPLINEHRLLFVAGNSNDFTSLEPALFRTGRAGLYSGSGVKYCISQLVLR